MTVSRRTFALKSAATAFVMTQAGRLFAQQAAVPDQHILWVFSNPIAGREAEFNGWYDTRHIPDVLNVPGFVAAQRFVFSEAQIGSPLPFRYAVAFELKTTTPTASVQELGTRLRNGVYKRGAAFDYSAFHNYLVHAIRPTVRKADLYPGQASTPAGNGEARSYQMMAFSSAVAGREDEYNTWYDKQHIPDVMRIDGIVGARRFALSDPAYGAQYKRQHLMVFDVEATDLKSVYETVRGNVRSGKTVPSSSFDGATYGSASVMAITERLTLATLGKAASVP